MTNETLSRRELIKKGLWPTTGVLGMAASNARAAAACFVTPEQQEGPYYPEGDLQRDADLTRFTPSDPVALGEIVSLEGRVLSPACQPIAGALVEIWQACASGKYNHSDDPNALPLDPNFQYWGRCLTGADGRYHFRTVIPGHYPVSATHTRPPHIHVKVHAKGFLSLTTQVYFDPGTYEDPVLAQTVAKLNAIEQVDPRLIVKYRRVSGSEKIGAFDLTLPSLRGGR